MGVRFSVWLWVLVAATAMGVAPVLAQSGGVLPATPGAAAATPSPAGAPVEANADPVPAVVGEAQVVAGNLASAKKRALESALVTLVEVALAPMLAERGFAGAVAEPPALAGLRGTVRAGARRFVRSYRIVAEEDLPAPNPRFRIQVQGEVDATALRRALEAALSSGPSVPGGLPVATDPGAAPVVLAGNVAPDLSKQLALTLARAGLRVDALTGMPARTLAEARTARPGAPAAAWVWLADLGTISGPVRGADRQAGQCALQATAFAGAGDTSAGSISVTEHGFSATTADALRMCELALVAATAARLAPLIAAATLGRGPVARAHAVWFLFDQPPVLERLQAALSKVAPITRAELRRVAVGQAEFRLHTELTAAALGSIVARELGRQFAVELLPEPKDAVHFRVRLPEAPPALPVTP